MKAVIGRNGLVVNIVGVNPEPPESEQEFVLLVDDNFVVNVGDAFDPRESKVDRMDVAVFRVLFRHENLIRQLIRALRATSSGANTQANTAGLPTAAQSADVTLAQAREGFKNLIP